MKNSIPTVPFDNAFIEYYINTNAGTAPYFSVTQFRQLHKME